MNLKGKRLERNLDQPELAALVGTTPSMISRLENYRCLPIPETLSALLAALGCEIDDIYDDAEITYPGFTRAKTKCQKNRKECYKITVRLPKDAKTALPEMLEKCGYKDITYWIWRCYERLQSQCAILEKEKSRPAATGSAR